jgi:YaiO family outer membrane protein
VGTSYSNNNPVFPNYTTGATLYVGLNGGWEVEGGYRQLKFADHIWVGSGGVSKYVGNWLFNITSYISLQTPADNQSYFVTAKRFFADSREMVWLQAGSGVSPDERRNVQLTTTNLRSKRLNAGAKFFVRKNTLLQLTAGYSRDEFREKTFGSQWNGAAGFAFLF